MILLQVICIFEYLFNFIGKMDTRMELLYALR